MDENRITFFAQTDARNKRVKFGIKAKDRTKHVYVIGKTGMGKSTLLENLAAQDIQNGEGMCFIDPHGKTAELMLEYVPKERIRDVIYIAPFDIEYPISFNVLENVDPDKRHLVVSGLMSTFKKIWVDAWSARMEYILTNTLLALLEVPGTTLLGVNRLLSDKNYRNEIVSQVKDPSVKSFWVKEFANYTERMAAEAIPAIQNKIGQFTANPLIRNMIGQSKSTFSFREAMDSHKIIIINLSKGRVGDENMKLLGGMLVTKIYLAAMSRADLPDRVMKVMPNFYLFVDEFQNFANQSFADILSEARKYKLNLTIAHQYIEQMEDDVRAAVFGNVGSMIVFRVGATDAEVLEKEFTPQFTLEDLANLGAYQIYLKLMIDGLTSAPFSASTLGPIPHPDQIYVNEIIAASREQFAQPRATIEAEVVKFHEATNAPAAKKTPAAAGVVGVGAAGAAAAPAATVGASSGSAAPVAGSAPVAGASTTKSPGAVASVASGVKSAIASALAKVLPVAPAKAPASAPVKPVAAAVKPAAVVAPKPAAIVAPKPVAPVILKAIETPKPAEIPKPVEVPKNIEILKPVEKIIEKEKPVELPVVAAKQAETPKPVSKIQPTAPVAPLTPPAPAPATHKPFASLGDLLAKKTPAPTAAPASDTTAPIKPVSLSTLAPQPARKVDPKVPTQQNVNSLKNALAAAMAKKAPVQQPVQSIAPQQPIAQPVAKLQAPVVVVAPPQEQPQKPQSVISKEVVIELPKDIPKESPKEIQKEPQKEVPEEVLHKVLKVE